MSVGLWRLGTHTERGEFLLEGKGGRLLEIGEEHYFDSTGQFNPLPVSDTPDVDKWKRITRRIRVEKEGGGS